jgi:tRNA U34 2-thiouridine synthase MnmA/TrmU
MKSKELTKDVWNSGRITNSAEKILEKHMGYLFFFTINKDQKLSIRIRKDKPCHISYANHISIKNNHIESNYIFRNRRIYRATRKQNTEFLEYIDLNKKVKFQDIFY